MQRYRLCGGGGSPYSMKMRAILRYRRLPFDWVLITPALREQLRHDGPPVIPILQFPDGNLQVDSTPLAYMLEDAHAERSIIPPDPCHGFLSDLIEDMADEWFTKMMFHYRWHREVDQIYSSRQIIADNSPGVTGEALERAAEAIRARQVGRMPIVGCTPENAPVIEAGYHEVLAILDTFVTREEFLFGTRPALADFGLFGQFKVLASDYTPRNEMIDRAPRVYDWIRRLDDLSGVDGHWHGEGELRAATRSLLQLAARQYLPFLEANRQAVVDGADSVELEIDGKPWRQAPFKYQAKCFDRLQKRFAAVEGEPAQRLGAVLAETGCLPYLEAPSS